MIDWSVVDKLGAVERRILGVLALFPGRAVDLLAKDVGRSRSQVQRVVDRMVKKGVVDTERRPVWMTSEAQGAPRP
jgi:predicted transcriptional regulator